MNSAVNTFIEDRTKNGDPFYTVTPEDWNNAKIAQIRNIQLSNQHPLGASVFKVQMPDGTLVKAVMRTDDLLKKVGGICASIESMGEKSKIHKWLRFALHGNTIATLDRGDMPLANKVGNANGTALPGPLDSEEIAQRKDYESWVAENEQGA